MNSAKNNSTENNSAENYSAEISFKQYVSIASKQLPALEGLQRLSNLDQAFRFLESIGIAVKEMDLLSQDEFTLDLIFPISKSSRCLVLAAS